TRSMTPQRDPVHCAQPPSAQGPEKRIRASGGPAAEAASTKPASMRIGVLTGATRPSRPTTPISVAPGTARLLGQVSPPSATHEAADLLLDALQLLEILAQDDPVPLPRELYRHRPAQVGPRHIAQRRLLQVVGKLRLGFRGHRHVAEVDYETCHEN